jgi:hypothetical protein
MTEETATRVATIILLAAGGAATWAILRDSRLRRPALGLLRTLVTGTVPALLAREIRAAWEASGQRSMMAG